VDNDCAYCNGTGLRHYPCKKCKGTGQYKRGNTVIGECNLCDGSGLFYPVRRGRVGLFEMINHIPNTKKIGLNCRHCKGVGFVIGEQTMRRLFSVCRDCDGDGEIMLWNPVIRPGQLGSCTVRKK